MREGTSLDGSAPLLRREFPIERREKLQADLAAAEADHAADPDGVDAIVWHARRLGYLDRFTEAIAVLTSGLEVHPDEPQLYRHRGHRYITVRKYQAAVADFTAAAALCDGDGGVPDSVEPDGAPNAAGIPTSTLHTNIYYHLGLARFLLGQYQQAADAYRKGLNCQLCTPTMHVAFSDWLYMSLRRLGDSVGAAEVLAKGGDEEDLLANFSYQKRLQLYKGLIGPEEVLSPVRCTGLPSTVHFCLSPFANDVAQSRVAYLDRMPSRWMLPPKALGSLTGTLDTDRLRRLGRC